MKKEARATTVVSKRYGELYGEMSTPAK